MKNIVFISGATASGKSSFAHKLIDNYFNNAAIISIDSIQVYRYMDIGSAKPSPEEIKKYNYKMVDILEPSVNFNIKEYLDIFKNVINSIDNVPIFGVGGTGFYIDAIKYGIFDEENAKAFKANFVLTEDLNNGDLKFSDKWVQRFNRPVQVTARPWILFDGNIYYSTKTLYESWMIRVERLNNGTVLNTTPEMQAFVSKVNNEKGHEFTINIKKLYESLSLDYLYVDSEVEIMPGKPLDSAKRFGDIDVLLINKNTKQIVCIEAKNFSESRTAYELIQQNRKIVTKELSHVIERDVWCKGNIDKFKFYVPEVDDEYSVKTIFLTYHENAYKYFEHEHENDITFLSAIEIVDNPMNVFI